MSEPLQMPRSDDLSNTLCASLNSVWNRYADSAPTDASIDFDAEVIRWSFPSDSAEALKAGIASRSDAEDASPVRTLAAFQRDTAAVVAKAMRRKIVARFSKKVKDGVATEVFVLETIPRKN